MKTALPNISSAYQTELGKHLRKGPPFDFHSARNVGLRAVTHGMEILDLAMIHQHALAALLTSKESSKSSDGKIVEAGKFFCEAVMPIEETHRGALDAKIQLNSLIETLRTKTLELAAAEKELSLEVVYRKSIQEALKISETSSSHLLGKSLQMQQELRHLSRWALTAQEDERKMISRELHDVVAQMLAGINLRLAALTTQTSANAKDFNKKIALTQKLVGKSVDIVHRFARDLRPTELDDLGLIPALKSYVQVFTKQTGIQVSFAAYGGVEKLESAGRTAIYRVVQEALTNVARHSKADLAKISITRRKGQIQMEIQDNGRGFDVQGQTFAKSSKRLGLLGMRERVEMVGGTFCVESAVGKNTLLRVLIPLKDLPARRLPAKLSKKAVLECP